MSGTYAIMVAGNIPLSIGADLIGNALVRIYSLLYNPPSRLAAGELPS